MVLRKVRLRTRGKRRNTAFSTRTGNEFGEHQPSYATPPQLMFGKYGFVIHSDKQSLDRLIPDSKHFEREPGKAKFGAGKTLFPCMCEV
jgi:hypothetical protein